jgi:hypothetical protein
MNAIKNNNRKFNWSQTCSQWEFPQNSSPKQPRKRRSCDSGSFHSGFAGEFAKIFVWWIWIPLEIILKDRNILPGNSCISVYLTDVDWKLLDWNRKKLRAYHCYQKLYLYWMAGSRFRAATQQQCFQISDDGVWCSSGLCTKKSNSFKNIN